MFSSCKELAKKSLAGHLLNDGSRLEDCVDSPQAGLQAWIRVRVGMLGPLLDFDPFRSYEWICWAKIHGTHNPHKDKITQQDDEQDHVVTKEQNIGNYGYIGTWILRIYRKYR